MADTRGRRSVGGFLGDYWQPSGPADTGVGQPTMVRTQGVPTGSGYRDRPGKWNFSLKPLFKKLAFIVLRSN